MRKESSRRDGRSGARSRPAGPDVASTGGGGGADGSSGRAAAGCRVSGDGPASLPFLTGEVGEGVKKRISEQKPEQMGVVMGCDRIEMRMSTTNPEPLLWGCTLHGWLKGKRAGVNQSWHRSAWMNVGEGSIRWCQTKWDNVLQTSLSAQFSPDKIGPAGLRLVGRTLGQLGDVRRAILVRVDAAFDFIGRPRRMLRLDPGQCDLTLRGLTPRGPETEWVGQGWAAKFQAQLYDKAAERRAKGVPCDLDWTRFEVRRQAPFPVRGEAEPRSIVRLGEMADLDWPISPGVVLREFVRLPDEHAEPRYMLLSATAWMYGTRAAEMAAREVLGRSTGGGELTRDVLRGCIWPEVEPSPRDVFLARWPRVAFDVIGEVCAGAAEAGAAFPPAACADVPLAS